MGSREAASPAVTFDDPVARARRLAEDLLWPAAEEIDRARSVPRAMLDAVADAGLYGLQGPREMGGLGADAGAVAAILETLGGASLATAFVWVQHHTTVRAIAESRPELRAEWLPSLCSGLIRSGIAVAALRRAGPPAMIAESHEGAVVLRGYAPWVTGWGLIDVVLIAAREGGDILWLLVDAAEGPSIQVERLALAAVDSSATVQLRVERLEVPAARVVGRELYSAWRAREIPGLTRSGFLAMGVAHRCAQLLGEKAGDLDRRIDRCRHRLLAARGPSVVGARVEASLLAVRAATALIAAGGGRSIESDNPAQRLGREAMFLLVFAQTEEIRREQLWALTGPEGA